VATHERWQLRSVPTELAERYRASGWWTDQTLGAVVAQGLGRMADVDFQVRSDVQPWNGTFAQVDRAARSLAATLQARGVGPGDVVAFQLPNWVEAGITFWAAAYLGAVVVPIVHFYGPKEVDYIIGATDPAVVVTADAFGASDYLAAYDDVLARHPVATWFVVQTGDRALPSAAAPLAAALDCDPLSAPVSADPAGPAIVAFTSGTTRDPKGVVHSHQTIGFETRQLDYLFPKGGPSQITGAPVGHFIGMVNAFLVPLLRHRSVHLIDVWDPTAVLAMMLEERLSVSGGATYFLTSLLDHPNFTDEHLSLMPFVGLGGSPVPAAVMERAEAMGIKSFRSYGSSEHPSITGCLLDDPVEKRMNTDGPVLPGVEMRLEETGEILSRGPDLCVGYTDETLTSRAFDDEGWYRTGDIGVLDDDGYLTITDRLSDVIIRGGENVGAQEVEELLLGMSTLAEVAVVAAPDERLGEQVAAVLRMRDGSPAPTLEQVQGHLRSAGLARQKWPESLYDVADFPRTPSGKIQKFVLRDEIRSGRLTPTERRLR
jgi:acyl-CoA synthetase